jgi:hypothetical protein
MEDKAKNVPRLGDLDLAYQFIGMLQHSPSFEDLVYSYIRDSGIAVSSDQGQAVKALIERLTFYGRRHLTQVFADLMD